MESVVSVRFGLGPFERATVAPTYGWFSPRSTTVALMMALLMPPYGARPSGATNVENRASCLLSRSRVTVTVTFL